VGVPVPVSKVVTCAPPAHAWIAVANGVTASVKQVPVTRMCNPPGEASDDGAAALSEAQTATIRTSESTHPDASIHPGDGTVKGWSEWS